MKRLLLILISVLPIVAVAQDPIRALVPRDSEVYRHAYQQLGSAERAVYDTIVDAFLHFEANNYSPYYFHRVAMPDPVDIMDIYALKDYYNRILCDMPELYIMSSIVPGYDYSSYVCFGKVGYQNTPATYLSELQQLEQIYDSFATGFTPGMTDYERLLVLHDAFINWGDYGDMTGANAGNVKGALINRRAVCEGFARAGLFLCQRAGIPCIYISGQLCTSTTNDTWTNHSWNYVYLRGAVPSARSAENTYPNGAPDANQQRVCSGESRGLRRLNSGVADSPSDLSADGEWYMMDLTTDGGFPNVCGYSAFLKGQAYLQANYRLVSTDGTDPNTPVYGTLPTISATDYDPNAVVTAIEETAQPAARKMMRDGRLVILREGVEYDALGREVR